MNKICFLFPGQGSQKSGMGIEIANRFKSCKEIFNCADDIFNFNLLKFSQEANEEELKKAKFCQPLIVATSIAYFKATEEEKIFADFLVGHSLGQYSAIFAAKILPLEETFKLLKLRIDAMEEFAPKDNVAMAAIIGAPIEKIEEECEKASGYVVCANFNSKEQTVISGEKTAVVEVVEKLENIAKRCVFLKVSSAFHSGLMKKAAKAFEKKIEKFQFNEPKTPIYSNVTASLIKDKHNIKQLLVEHFEKPVLFTKILEKLEQEGVLTFIEVGEGKILSSLVKKTIKEASFIKQTL